MPPPTESFLLKITLVKTKNPIVFRLLNIPSTLTFTELHCAIAGSFGWASLNDLPSCWLFRLWTGDPVKHCDQVKKYQHSLAAYSTAESFALTPRQLKTDANIGDFFKKEGLGRYWAYEYEISRFHHAVEVVAITDNEPGRIACLGGQGSIGRKAWQLADLAGVEGLTTVAKSAWDFDTTQLNARLNVVQNAWEMRNEAAVDVGKIAKDTDQAKTTINEPEQAAAKDKTVNQSPATPSKMTVTEYKAIINGNRAKKPETTNATSPSAPTSGRSSAAPKASPTQFPTAKAPHPQLTALVTTLKTPKMVDWPANVGNSLPSNPSTSKSQHPIATTNRSSPAKKRPHIPNAEDTTVESPVKKQKCEIKKQEVQDSIVKVEGRQNAAKGVKAVVLD